MKRRWSESESTSDSDSSTEESESDSEEPLDPQVIDFLEIGGLFLEKSGLQWWFDGW